LCGPAGMMEAAQTLLEGTGIASTQIHRDRF
jgi:ferredoxin-NADP reductase